MADSTPLGWTKAFSMNTALEMAKAVHRDLANLTRHDAPSVRAIRRRYSKALKSESPEIVLEFVRILLRSAGWAERVVAWETLASHQAALDLLDDELVEEMAEGLSAWESVDLYGVTVLGQAWREGRVTDATILSWTQSQDRWRRRLALVATVPLNSRARGGKGDGRRTLLVCRALLADRDDMVVKAMSWALRELAKRSPDVVADFIRDEDDRLAPRVRREVLNKLETGLASRVRSLWSPKERKTEKRSARSTVYRARMIFGRTSTSAGASFPRSSRRRSKPSSPRSDRSSWATD